MVYTSNQRLIRVKLSLAARNVKKFLFIFEEGIIVEIAQKYTLRDFICCKLGFKEKYLNSEIKTILLNNRAVDNINLTTVTGSCSIALSAAMPGVVGSALRREGPYAPLRREISFDDSSILNCPNNNHFVVVKMFNSISAKFGETFLQQGVIITRRSFVWIIKKTLELENRYKISIVLNGSNLDPEKIDLSILEANFMFLTLEKEENSY